MGIGTRIRQLRERAGLTQEELALRIGVTPSAVGNYEREVSHPRGDVLYRLFNALCAQPNELFQGMFEDENESEHMEKYRALDEQGRQAVDACTETEYARCTAGEGAVLIAARGSGAPHFAELKKRDSSASILDCPDYKGGRK